MIANVTTVAASGTRISYIMGEAASKKQPEKIYFIKHNLMPDDFDAKAVADAIDMSVMRRKSTRPLKYIVFRVELSPDREATKNFTDQDWLDFTNKYVEIFDSLEFKDKKGKIYSPKTNWAGSKYIAYLHRESASGIPHVHLLVSRVDENGNINNDHNRVIRAHQAAERLDRFYGWSTAMEVSKRNHKKVSADCMKVLKAMPRWDFEDYRQRLLAMGYDGVEARRDSNGKIVGYTIKKGKTIYKASKLGTNRNLMAKNIAGTWAKLHCHEPAKAKRPIVPSGEFQRHNQKRYRQNIQPVVDRQFTPQISEDEDDSLFKQSYNSKYLSFGNNMVSRWINIDGQDRRFFIPTYIDDELDRIFSWTDYDNSDELKNKAMAFFVGYLDAEMQATRLFGSGGGGTSSNLPWGRDPKEDELEWLHRCAQQAMKKVKPISKSKGQKR